MIINNLFLTLRLCIRWEKVIIIIIIYVCFII